MTGTGEDAAVGASPRGGHRLEKLFNPRSVAIVGIKEKIQYGTVLDNMLGFGFDRENLFLVNPYHPSVRGIDCLPQVPPGTDAAFLLVRNTLVPPVLRELVEAEVGSAVVVASGFAERGSDGEALQSELSDVADRLVVCGPNTMGVGNLHTGAVLWGGPLPDGLEAGPVAAVFQSGGMTNLFLQLAATRGIGVGKFVVAGNEAGVTVADYLDYLVQDEETQTIALYFESAQDGRHLREALAAAHARGKRVVALVAGRSERSKATVATHTGNIAAGDRWARVLEGFGVAVVSTFDDLVELTLLCSLGGPISSPRMQLLTVSGGESTWMTDLAAEVGLELPPISAALRKRLEEILGRSNFVGNPMDIGGLLRGPKPQQFIDVVTACSEECDSEMVGLRLNLPRDFDDRSAEPYRLAADIVAKAGRSCVFLTRASEPLSPQWRAYFESLGVPLLQELRRALHSVVLRARAEATVPPAVTRPPQSELSTGNHLLGELRGLLEKWQIATVFERSVWTSEELNEIFAERNGPFVMKLESPELPHKSDAAAVVLGLEDLQAATTAFTELQALAARLGLSSFGVVVQEEVRDAVELLIGGSHDEERGPVVVVGHGGVLAEIFIDTLVLPAPFEASTVRAQLARLPGATLLGPYRGRAACDLDELAATVAQFSQLLAEASPVGSEWDLNPVMARRGATGRGSAVVVDALAVVS